MKFIAKWGFGMAPISDRMQIRYDIAVQTMLDMLAGNLTIDEINLEALSDLKGMFNRCIRQDQWDWFSVYTELGTPTHYDMKKIVALLIELRQSIIEKNRQSFDYAKSNLINSNILRYLASYQSDLCEHICEPDSGWIYILSTREQPEILKIGMTHRSVSQRVKEINSATGVIIPFAARFVARVKNSSQAEKGIFELLSEYRIRGDREFFNIPFSRAVNVIQEYLSTSKMKYRQKGTVIWFEKQKHYGFISVEGSADVFLHSSQIRKDDLIKIVPGAIIEFDLGKRLQGMCAQNVTLVKVDSN